MGEGDVRAHVFVTGRVQGVGFRVHTQMQAQSLGLTGWVRNETDGAVTALFTGTTDTVDMMTARLWEGPPLSDVAGVQLQEGEPEDGLTRFEIRA